MDIVSLKVVKLAEDEEENNNMAISIEGSHNMAFFQGGMFTT